LEYITKKRGVNNLKRREEGMGRSFSGRRGFLPKDMIITREKNE